MFVGAPNLSDVEEGVAAVRERLQPRFLIGCGAQGVVGRGPRARGRRGGRVGGVAPEATLESFRLEATSAGESAVAVSGMPDLDEAHAVIMLVDPYTFPIEPLLAQIANDHPGLR